jgi:nicotinate-nucleotide adenylyltransferase
MNAPPDAGIRIAFFGGSFDPPHLGHLAVARAALRTLSLDSVVFAPVGAQPLKSMGSTAGFDDRLAMTRLAIAGEPRFAVSLADAPKPSGEPNYTLETLVGLRDGLAPGGELFCLMGADSFLGLRRWHRAAEIPFVASLVVASRPGQPLDGLAAALPEGVRMESAATGEQDSNGELRSYLLRDAAGNCAPFFVLPGLHVEVSASEIRQQVRGAAEVPAAGHELLPKPVFDYIRAHGIYR